MCPSTVNGQRQQSTMKFSYLCLCLFWASFLSAQEIPFIQRGQIEHWKQADTDTIFVINFWATWCGPCVAELPAFERLNKRYKDKKVQVILVSNDFKKQVDTKLKPFVHKKKLKSRVVFMNESNPNNWVNLVSPDWSGALPATLIISKRKGKVLFFEKQLNYAALEAALLSVM